MGRSLVPPLAKIDGSHTMGVDREELVRIDDTDEETGVAMDHLGLVTALQVVEDRGVIEEGQVDHVLAHLKLRRVDLAHQSGLVGEFLVTHRDLALGGGVIEVSRLEDSLTLSTILGVGTPDGLLGVIWLLEILLLHLHGGP